MEFDNMLAPRSLILAGYLGYAWRSFMETRERAVAVSSAGFLAELHGMKVVHWPGGRRLPCYTVGLVDADSLEPVVNWSRHWRRWECLGDLIR